jgi:hypothetical protein
MADVFQVLMLSSFPRCRGLGWALGLSDDGAAVAPLPCRRRSRSSALRRACSRRAGFGETDHKTVVRAFNLQEAKLVQLDHGGEVLLRT